jgi:hypothetical protein
VRLEFRCISNGCGWLHESQTLEGCREKTSGSYIRFLEILSPLRSSMKLHQTPLAQLESSSARTKINTFGPTRFILGPNKDKHLRPRRRCTTRPERRYQVATERRKMHILGPIRVQPFGPAHRSPGTLNSAKIIARSVIPNLVSTFGGHMRLGL